MRSHEVIIRFDEGGQVKVEVPTANRLGNPTTFGQVWMLLRFAEDMVKPHLGLEPRQPALGIEPKETVKG